MTCHETGDDERSDLIKDADGISYFEVNLPLYFEREGWKEAKQRSIWGYLRLSTKAKETVESMTYKNEALTQPLLGEHKNQGGKPLFRNSAKKSTPLR